MFLIRERFLICVIIALLFSTTISCRSSGVSDKEIKLSNTHFLLGSDYLDKKQPFAAKRELLQAISYNPENQEAQQLLGLIFFMEGTHKLNQIEREDCLQGALAAEQQVEADKDFHHAEEYFNRAVAIAQKEQQIDSDSLNNLANISLHFKKYDQTISLCQRGLENMIYSQRQFLLGTMGWAYYLKGDKQAAGRELRQSVFHEPKFCLGRYRLAKLYYEQGNLEKSLEQLKEVIKDKACPIPEAHELMGVLLVRQGKEREKAYKHFVQCVSMAPRSCVAKQCQRLARDIGSSEERVEEDESQSSGDAGE